MSDKILVVTEQIDSELATLASQHNPAAAYLLSLKSNTSRYSMARRLDRVVLMLDGDATATWRTFRWSQVRAGYVEAITATLAGKYSPGYVNAILAGIRGVMAKAYDYGLIDDKTALLINRVKTIRNERSNPAGRYVTVNERDAIMATCAADPTPAGRRDMAILACGYPGGLRRAEIASLQRSDVVDEGKIVTVSVIGTGNKKRVVPFDNGGAEALRGWLAERGDTPGPLFWRGYKGGGLELGIGLTSQAIYGIIKKRADRAGVGELIPHDLRRTTASDLLNVLDTVTAAKILGHASESTTARYDGRRD